MCLKDGCVVVWVKRIGRVRLLFAGTTIKRRYSIPGFKCSTGMEIILYFCLSRDYVKISRRPDQETGKDSRTGHTKQARYEAPGSSIPGENPVEFLLDDSRILPGNELLNP